MSDILVKNFLGLGDLVYNECPATHRNDPETSAMAERDVTFSGIRGNQMRDVLKMVQGRQGLTSAEYAMRDWALGLGVCIDRAAIARRLPDLQKLGIVKQGAKRKCTDTGRMCVTWWLV